MVQQPARRGDQHVHAPVDQLVLFAKGHAADQQRLGQAGMFRIGVKVLGHLGRQFAGRAQDQAARHPRTRASAPQKGDHRQHEACRLARAGLRDPQNVAAFQGRGDGAGLDRRRRFIPGLGDGLDHVGIELEIGEFRHSGAFQGLRGGRPARGVPLPRRPGGCCGLQWDADSHAPSVGPPDANHAAT